MDDGVISIAERDLLWNIHMALSNDKQADDYDHEAILESASWKEVVRIAAEVVQTLREILHSASDNAAFQNELPSSQAKKWP